MNAEQKQKSNGSSIRTYLCTRTCSNRAFPLGRVCGLSAVVYRRCNKNDLIGTHVRAGAPSLPLDSDYERNMSAMLLATSLSISLSNRHRRRVERSFKGAVRRFHAIKRVLNFFYCFSVTKTIGSKIL